jgi:deoxyribodipyrimidine photolyase-related protein
LERDEMRSRNYFQCENPMPEEFYTAETSIPPVDVSIQNALDNCYGHHIERLMVLGNMMLLLEIDPDEVYEWFMELFIDSYDWVMVPNVYGMSQYADPRIMTKPYISSSNYIQKMSHYESGKWENYWDGLYWNFIKKHRSKIEENNRMGFMVSTLDRMNEDTVEEHVENAQEFKDQLSLK